MVEAKHKLHKIEVVKCKRCGHTYVPRKENSQFCPKCRACILCGIHHMFLGTDCSKVKKNIKENIKEVSSK